MRLHRGRDWRSAAAASALTALALALVVARASAAPARCPEAMTRAIPSRAAGAATGRDFAGSVAGSSGPEREQAIETELLAGNLPSFLRRLKPVELEATPPGHAPVRVTLCVTPDYLAVGSDRDFLHLPMALPTAIDVGRAFGFLLPTRRMVDEIYREAAVRLEPEPLPASDQMRSTAYYVTHERLLRRQRASLGAGLDELISGHKKDLVLTERLRTHPERVAIYGWHKSDGNPIQPLSTVHGARYADYSHGVRLVSLVAYVDGRPRSLVDLLEDPVLGPALTGEGPIHAVGELVEELDSGGRPAPPIGSEASELVRLVSDAPQAR
jgi:hypothetical protein